MPVQLGVTNEDTTKTPPSAPLTPRRAKRLIKEKSLDHFEDTTFIASSNVEHGQRYLGSKHHHRLPDLIFDLLDPLDNGVIEVGKFLEKFEHTGILRSDPRIQDFEEKFKLASTVEGSNASTDVPIDSIKVNRETFTPIANSNISFVGQAFRQQFVIPDFHQFCDKIEEIYNEVKSIGGGAVPQFIPGLARVDPKLWGVSVCTIDGQRYSIGDTKVPFTLQSCSKALTYGIVLNELGSDTVHKYIGHEPSGQKFNELVLSQQNKPHNPMINSGAITVCSLLQALIHPELSHAEKFEYIMNYYKRLGGGSDAMISFNNAMFLSERDCADRNYALGFYMKEHKCFPPGIDLKECLDFYFQCCSMNTDCDTGAVMAATLANGGICPIGEERVLKAENVRDVLSLMLSCGMYDYSGQFALNVGLPAKSGVSGCILLVVPKVLGMCIYSPPLDAVGNTVRGVALCKRLVKAFNFHKYDNLRNTDQKIDPRRYKYEAQKYNLEHLLLCAASGDITTIRRYHSSGMDISASNCNGRTALHIAAAEGHLECVEYILEQCSAPAEPVDRWGHSPLDDANLFGQEEVAAYLKYWCTHGPIPSIRLDTD